MPFCIYSKNYKNYSSLSSKDKLNIIKNNIFGVDLDEKAVAIAELNIYLKLLVQKGQASVKAPIELLPELKNNVKVGDSLIDDVNIAQEKAFKWDEKYSDIIKLDENGKLKEGCGFDIILGNPPYILLQNTDYSNRLDFFVSKYSVAQYKVDTYHLFFERAINLLHNNGYVGFITPNTFWKNKFTMKLRELIFKTCAIRTVVLIPENVFPAASVDTSIVILQKTKNPSKNIIDMIRIKDDFRKEINSNPVVVKIKQSDILETQDFALDISLDISKTALLSKFETGYKLGDIANAYFGIQTFDRTKFVKDTKQDENWKPTIDGSNVLRYLMLPSKEFILFKKDAIKSGGKESIYESLRIVTRQIGKYPIFCLVPSGTYALNTTYNITLNKQEIDIRFILGILNSKANRAYWIFKFTDYKATFPKIKKAPLLAMPIPQASQAEVANLIAFVEKMITLNKELYLNGDKNTNKVQELKDEINQIDDKIDVLVYHLYKLTPDEQKIIEDNLD